MDMSQRARNEPSIHQAALANLRRGGRRTAMFFGVLFLVIALFTGASMLLASQTVPTPPSPQAAPEGGTSGGPGASSAGQEPSRTRDQALDDTAGAWRKQLVAFLNSATEPTKYDPGRWFPGSAAPHDTLRYTPLNPDDPGKRHKDGTAQVSHTDMSDSDVKAVLHAVSRAGSVLPTSISPVSTSGTNRGWTMFFSVTTKDGKHLKGQADGYSHPQNGTVIERFTYQK
ncbi:hypothetical protein [Streptomyces sp. PU-14G]|uniref:hypothetical protein n=1 Tax=Streptomyces sp. PU-14G TaxID=2800808 RepID=UPI0034DEEEF1